MSNILIPKFTTNNLLEHDKIPTNLQLGELALSGVNNDSKNLTLWVGMGNGSQPIKIADETYATDEELSKKADDYSIEIYNGIPGNPMPIKFATVDYSSCDSENGVAAKIGMVSTHGNGMSYAFLQEVIIRADNNGTVEVDNFKYYGDETPVYDGKVRQYGDIFWVIDTTSKIIDFYCLMGQFARLKQIPWKRLTYSSGGTVTQYTSATVYSSGTIVWANNRNIATIPSGSSSSLYNIISSAVNDEIVLMKDLILNDKGIEDGRFLKGAIYQLKVNGTIRTLFIGDGSTELSIATSDDFFRFYYYAEFGYIQMAYGNESLFDKNSVELEVISLSSSNGGLSGGSTDLSEYVTKEEMYEYIETALVNGRW